MAANVAIDAEVDLNLVHGRLLPQNASRHQPAGFRTEAAQAQVDEAHEICPYYRATRGNIEVAMKLV